MRYWIGCILFCWVCVTVFNREALGQKVAPIKINASNATLYRDSLNKFIFGASGFPYDILPDSVTTNVSELDLFSGWPYTTVMYPLGNLDSVDRIVVTIGDDIVDFPSKASIYLFHPHESNGKLFIYHSGHCAGITTSEDIVSNNNVEEPGLVIPALLEKGYTVLAVPMLNYQHTAPMGYYCGINNHDRLFIDNHYQYPLSFFFKPLIASLNALGRNNYSAIYMCGLSGGGWTTSIYPALDSSIIYSFPVAGSWPNPVKTYFGLYGDLEQYYPPLFNQFLDFHEIYTLSCLAPARKMLQVNNRYDPCCFSGTSAHIYYADSVAKALQGSGGQFKFYLDESGTQHAITKRAVDVIFTALANQYGSLQVNPEDSVTGGTNYFYDIKNNFIVNTAADNSTLKYSLLKAPAWINMDADNGSIQGTVPAVSIMARTDTVSFKVEDSTGRFVVYNYILNKKREAPFFFTKYNDNQTLYFLPAYSHSINTLQQSAAGLFFFNNPAISITNLAIENNSFIRMSLNIPVTAIDSIGYNGSIYLAGLVYSNGLKFENFGLTKINLDAVTRNFATAGMIRFNKETKKFEYFNGTDWIEMN